MSLLKFQNTIKNTTDMKEINTPLFNEFVIKETENSSSLNSLEIEEERKSREHSSSSSASPGTATNTVKQNRFKLLQ